MKASDRSDAPPRREKENMDAPQEEFIADQSVPSKSKSSHQSQSKINKRNQVPQRETQQKKHLL